MNLQYANQTSTGRVRSTNQDAMLALPGPEADSWVFAVADGVGGLVDGADASQSVVDAIENEVRSGSGPLAPRLEAALKQVNSDVFGQGAAMGRPRATTIVLVSIEHETFSVLHAGDSRAYLLRDGRLSRLTADHGWVAEQLRAGTMTAEQAENSPYRNVITRAVGVEPSVAVERREPAACLPGDVYLLCSDGLHGLVDDEKIQLFLAEKRPCEEIAAQLVDIANASGGTDNISVVVARVEA